MLTVWDDHDIEADHFLGEILLDLNTIDLTTSVISGAGGAAATNLAAVGGVTGGGPVTPLWFHLDEHDLNVGPTPEPPNKYLLVQGTVKSVDESCGGGGVGGASGEESSREKLCDVHGSSRSLPSTPAHSHIRDFLHCRPKRRMSLIS